MATTDAAAHPLDAALETLKADLPRITDAAKNLCSILAAADLARVDDQQPVHELPCLLAVAKVVLASINAHSPPPPEKWALLHPQGDENGSDRIEELTRYRACHALQAQASAAGVKVTKLLGRGFLRATRCWTDSAEERARAALADEARFAPHTVRAFLDAFGSAIDDDDADGAATEGVSGLVWAADFNAALQARRAARMKEAAERAARMQDSATEAQALRDALTAEEGEEEEGDEGEDDEDDDAPRVIEVELNESQKALLDGGGASAGP